MKRLVIIGNGVAAAGCVEGIRSVDAESEIVVVSAERWPVYCRPLISYYLEGLTPLENMGYRPESFYEKNNCKVLYGRKVVSLDSAKKELRLDDDSTLKYDAVCVATGSCPFVPPMQGLETVKSKFSFMTLDDALALEQNIGPESRVLIVGAGLIGLKCAEGICDRVKSVAVCDLAPRVLSSVLDDVGAAMMRRHLEAHGLTFYLGDSAAAFEGNVAIMKSGARIEFDTLVLAVGVRPNISLVRDNGGACGRAIQVDVQMKTSLPDVYAAGDCTESFDVSSGTVKIMALLPSAFMQGKCAGANMAGGNVVLKDGMPMNSIGFWGFHAITAGTRYEEQDGGEVYIETTDNSMKKLYVKDGRLTGFILLGNVERAGIYTAMIRNQTPIDSLDFEEMKRSPSLYPFGAERRGEMLGRLAK